MYSNILEFQMIKLFLDKLEKYKIIIILMIIIK